MEPDFLDSSEAIYRSLIEASDDFVFAVDLGGKFIFANAKTIETFGNLIGKPFTLPIPSEYHDVVKKNFKRRVQGEKVAPYPIEVINKNGKRFWVEISGSSLVKDDKVIGAVYFERDITERKKAEDALRASEARLRTIIDSEPECVKLVALDGTLLEMNPAGLAMIGAKSSEQVCGKSVYDLILSEDLDRFRTLHESATRGVAGKAEFRIVGLDNRKCYMESHSVPWRDVDDNIVAVLSVTRDITERKKAEESTKWQLMKFRIEKGNSYLVKETKPTVSRDVYLDLINCGFSGTILSRRRSEDIKEVFGEETEVFWIAEKTGEKIIAPDLEEIESLIEKLPPGNNVVILDRLDYLIVTNGFENTLRFIQKLTELFYLKRWVLLIALDPNTLGKRELGLLENETNPVKPSHSLDLDEDIYEILKYVYKEEKEGRKPAYRDVGLKCGITKQTTRKRIEILKGEGYLIDKKKGRYKILELTEKGKYLF